ncbi:MAG: DUF559 domain-containing protein [Solirubrobacterales bacterium]
MAPKTDRSRAQEAWALARRQHGEISRAQLLALGFGAEAIRHRVAIARLHPIRRGVYAVGRAEVGRIGALMAAALVCGAPLPPSYEPRAWLSHLAATELWRMLRHEEGPIDVSVRRESRLRQPGIRIHRRPSLDPRDLTKHRDIPVTAPARTLVDIAPLVPERWLRRAVNQADALELIDPVRLRSELARFRGEPGVRALRDLLDRDSFAYTDSDLEDAFLALALMAGLPPPLTQPAVNGFPVDFFWPELGLVVEADSLRYHRTPSEQAADHRRDQAHTASGLTPLRFTHGDIRFEPGRVVKVLKRTAGRLDAQRAKRPRGSQPAGTA